MIAALILMATLVAAPQQQNSEPKATPEEIAAARSHADELIRAGDATGVFENITDDAAPTVLHRASGLTCAFSGDRREYVHVFAGAPGALPRGEDVGCGVRLMGVEHTLYATRYPDRHSAEQDLMAASAALTQRLPNARPHTGEIALVTREGGPQVQVAAYDIEVDGQPMLTMILVAKAGEWNFKQRSTASREDTSLTLVAGGMFILSLPGGRAAPAPETVSAGRPAGL